MYTCVGYCLDKDHKPISLGRVCVSMSTKEALIGEFDLAIGPKHEGLYVYDPTGKRPIDRLLLHACTGWIMPTGIAFCIEDHRHTRRH